MRIRYSGTIRAICPPAAFCQQSELGLCPVRRALQRRIQGFLDRRPRSASPPVHNSITCTRAGLSVVADMSSHRGDVGPEFCQKPENFGKPGFEGLKARP